LNRALGWDAGRRRGQLEKPEFDIMKILTCPLNGPRNISEFVWGGEVKALPDPATASDKEWTDFLFLEDNIAGETLEWWLHAPSNFWFIARRDTLSDEILETMTVETFKARQGLRQPPGSASETAGSEDGA
jgi:sarcosine oxidase, subunit delta